MISQAPVTTRRHRNQQGVVAMLHLLVLVLAALHLYVRTLPATATPLPTPQDAEAAWWGLWPITYLPAGVVATALGALLIYLVVWWLSELAMIRWPLAIHLSTARGFYLIIGLLVVAFYLFPIQHTRWGDAYILSKAIALADPTVRLTYSWQAPLDVFIHSQVWQSLHTRFDWEDATGAYRLLSPLAGAFYLFAALAAARRLHPTPTWLTFGLLSSLGVMQLFFGYIENYSFAAAGILIYLGLGIATLQGERPLWLAATALAVTIACHPSILVLTPSLLSIGWILWRARNKSGWFVVLSIAIPLAVIGLTTLGLMEAGGHGIAALLTTDRPGGGDARFFVPLWTTTTRWEQYTMFSWYHLRDLLNEQLLVAPVVLPTLLIIAPFFLAPSRGRELTTATSVVAPAGMPAQTDRKLLIFLASATLCHLLLIWLWNPDYGGQRDWDLFSLAAIPSTLLLAWGLPRRLTQPRALQGGAIGLLMLQCLHTAAWIYQNTLPWDWP